MVEHRHDCRRQGLEGHDVYIMTTSTRRIRRDSIGVVVILYRQFLWYAFIMYCTGIVNIDMLNQHQPPVYLNTNMYRDNRVPIYYYYTVHNNTVAAASRVNRFVDQW